MLYSKICRHYAGYKLIPGRKLSQKQTLPSVIPITCPLSPDRTDKEQGIVSRGELPPPFRISTGKSKMLAASGRILPWWIFC
ncbi:hypothetical protein JTE90_019573 [Oedothorax gibbosus]|uniref:Uncharacterized protein n=1 Tax=Oedothorax gibbosus TaxID=931172 RepID=A0AAV6V4P3_9ARAC|nr:hypothetical protein JTE90_019573 [Oedothorax gibbosus]